ncbi:hypothetical protein IAT40_002314 [Kwoniella sp. CBS 6097]
MVLQDGGEKIAIPYAYLEAYPYPAFVLSVPAASFIDLSGTSSLETPLSPSADRSPRSIEELWSNKKWEALAGPTSLVDSLGGTERTKLEEWLCRSWEQKDGTDIGRSRFQTEDQSSVSALGPPGIANGAAEDPDRVTLTLEVRKLGAMTLELVRTAVGPFALPASLPIGHDCVIVTTIPRSPSPCHSFLNSLDPKEEVASSDIVSGSSSGRRTSLFRADAFSAENSLVPIRTNDQSSSTLTISSTPSVHDDTYKHKPLLRSTSDVSGQTDPSDVSVLFENMDWNKTPLGPRESWPQSLKTLVSVLFAYPTPACIWWGPELTIIYNQANAKTIDKHPEIFGKPGREAWAEAWDWLGPLAETALSGTPVWKEDDFFVLDAGAHNGNRYYECYHSWMWVPIVQEDGTIGGLWNTTSSTTERVLLERRLATLRDVGEQTSVAKSIQEFDDALANAFTANPKDIPFFALYHADASPDAHGNGTNATLLGADIPETVTFNRTATAGVPSGPSNMPSSFHVHVPHTMQSPNAIAFGHKNLDAADERRSSAASSAIGDPLQDILPTYPTGTWPFQKAFHHRRSVIVEDCRDLISGFPIRVWDELPCGAIVIPIANDSDQPTAMLVMGLNVRRPFDKDYADFILSLAKPSYVYDRVKTQLATSLKTVGAAQAERKQMEDMEALDRAKSVLFSNISHEFRTPLTLIAGPIEDLLVSNTDARQKDLLQLARNNVFCSRRLNRLVSSLMNISRLEAGKLSCVFQSVNLGEITQDLAEMFRNVAEKAHLQYDIVCDTSLKCVFVDPDQWEKIVLNLISNAIKYTLQGGIQVSLQYENDCAILRVTDTGVGIPTSDLDHIGERFHRVASISRSHEGTGIGLSLAKHLVHLHGGTFKLSSATAEESPDGTHGSTFAVSLPLGSEHISPDAIYHEKAPYHVTKWVYGADIVHEAKLWNQNIETGMSTPGTDEVSEFNFETSHNAALQAMHPDAMYFTREDVIMVVDDSYETRKYIHAVFSPYCKVVEARDGREALDFCRNQQPDLLITDVMMPHVDGFQLLNALKTSQKLKSIPVIMCTARGGEESKIEGLMAGADDYLSKPFSAKELIARSHVQLLLGKNRKQLSKAFEEQTQELRAVTDYSPVGLFRISEEQKITFVNQTWYDLSGYSKDEPIEGWIECIADDHKEKVIKFWMNMYEGNEQDTKTLDLQFKNGRWASLKIVRLDLVSGDLKGLLGCVTDITNRVQQQEAQKQRIVEIEERRLEAEEAKRQQELLIDITSHEIRNPISSLMQISYFFKTNLLALKDQMEDAVHHKLSFTPTRQLLNNMDEDLEALESVYQCGLGQERICNDVLSLGRIQLELFDVDINISQQVQKVLSVFQSEARMHRISLSSKMGQNARNMGIDMIKTDPVRLNQVMTNLLSNGIRFTSNSDVRKIELSFDLSLDPPEDSSCLPPKNAKTSLVPENEQPIYLYVAVTDTGPGMTTGELQKLFHRFSQVSPKTHTIFGGSGLGLFVCRMGGRIEVVSDHGKGSSFRFFIKARTCRAPPRPNGIHKLRPPPLKKRDTERILSSTKVTVPGTDRKPNILIVEDNLINQTVLMRQLKHVGFACQVANNGLEALRKVRSVSALDGSARGQPFDCILMDLEMPVMDGLTAVRQLREEEAAGKLDRNAVIALTGNARQGQIDEAKAAGMDEVVIKPYRLDNLLNKIEGMLSQRTRPSNVAEKSTELSSAKTE